jgi:nucleotide-binding universal stress UspA family protein
MLELRTILHPTDFSERSEGAFQAACSLARDHGARLVVLYVQQPDVVVCAEYTAYVPDPIQTPADVKESLSARHAIDPGLDVEYRVANGDPTAQILHAARELNANLIVMGTHGRTGLGRLLMGSVAEAVSRRAPCPVLTLKAPFPVGAVESAAAKELAAV